MKIRDPQARMKTRDRLDRVTTRMNDDLSTWKSHGSELARYSQPRLSRYLSGDGSASLKGDRTNDKLLDGRGIMASEILANGMASGMANPSTPWFKLTVEDPGLREYADVKAWLSVVEDRLYSFFARTNFYASAKAGYMQLAIFGTAATIMMESPRKDGVCYPQSFGEYAIGLDHELGVERFLRRVDMTVIQLYEKFFAEHGEDCFPQLIKDQYKNSQYDVVHQVWHYIEPNGDQVWGKLDATNKPFRSYYWLANSPKDCLLSVGGFDERPFWAPRWEVSGSDVYGRSPAMNALPVLKELQLSHLRKAQAKDYMVGPAMVGPSVLGNRAVSLVPRSLTTLPQVDNANFRAAFEVDPNAVNVLREDIMETRTEVDAYFYADLFNAITNMRGIQPRNMEEIASRNEEKLTQLGPVVDRNQNEMLRPAIDRAYGILERMGLIPDPPEQMDGHELKIEFVGILAQMQRAVGVGAIERALGFVGNLIATFPEAADKVDVDQAIDEYTDRIGTPPSMIRSDDAVAELREQRSNQQAMAAAGAAAQPVAQAADAARLLSETDTGDGASLLSKLVNV